MLMAGSLGAGYLWAVALGYGIHGGLSGAALDNGSTYPDANLAILVAVALASLGPPLTALFASMAFGWPPARPWRLAAAAGASVLLGLGLFGIWRLIT